VEPDPEQPTASIDSNQIRAQLKRMLEHAVFSSSRRCSQLLEHLVECKLRGEAASPKERTLGIEVFDREPDYDTANDPVVRSAANEIRKRIAQYYHKPGHKDELRFDLPSGSYLLEFHTPEGATAPQSIQSLPGAQRRYSPYYAIVAAAVLVLGVLSVIWLRAPSALDRFWSPVLDSPNRLLISVLSTSAVSANKSINAKIGVEVDPSRAAIESVSGIPFISLTDGQALASIVRYFTARRVNFEMQYQTFDSNLPDDYIQPSLDELRKGPTVFVGGSDWTFRTLPSLRFHPKIDNAEGIIYVEDSEEPSNKKWKVKLGLPFPAISEDYGIITRISDSMTGQIMVFVCGLRFHGTGAASEFVTNPSFMNEVASSASPEWQKKNVQIVIYTKVAGKAWGTPKLVAKHFW